MKTTTFIVFMLILIGCSNINTIDDGTIVLEINGLSINKYQLKAQLEPIFINYYRQNNKFIPIDSILSLTKNTIDEMYIMAEAYSERYDTSIVLNKSLEARAKLATTSVYGLLWNEVELPKLHSTDKEVKEAIERSKKIYYTSILFFTDSNAYNTLLKQYNNEIQNPNIDFYALANYCKKHPNSSIHFSDVELRWPFIEFATKQHFLWNNLAEGITLPAIFTHNCISIIHVNKIDSINKINDKNYNLYMKEAVYKAKEAIALENNRIYVKTKAQLQLSNLLFNKLGTYFDRHNLNDSVLNLINGDSVLFSFNFNHMRRQISLAAFVDYYNYLPMKQNIKSKEALKWAIENYVDTEILYKDAEEKGIFNKKEYALKKDLHKKEYVEGNYMADYLRKHILLTDSVLLAYYNQNSNQYTQASAGVFNVYSFKNANEANKFIGENNLNPDTNKLNKPGDNNIINIKIYYTHNTLPTTDKEHINNMEVHSLYLASFDGSFKVFFKKSNTGNTQMLFTQVKGSIINYLYNQQVIALKKELINKLKTKYTLKTNLIKDFTWRDYKSLFKDEIKKLDEENK